MNNEKYIHRFLQLIILALLLTTALHAKALSLSFGVYTADSPTVVVDQFRPILNETEVTLEDVVGEPVTIKMQIAPTYEQGVQDLINGKVDFSRLGPASYVTAKQSNPSVSRRALESRKNQKRFQGISCVQEESPITSIKELKGKHFAFGNPKSTIGHYLAQQYLMQNGIYARDLSSYTHLERHDIVGLAIAHGQYDAGALKESTFNRLIAQGNRLRAIASFDNITKPWVASALLDDKLKEQLKDVLISLENKDAFNALKKDGFLPGKDEDFLMVRSAMANNLEFVK